MFELKPLSEAAIPRALEKAERYRLLNEPEQAESICLDVLEIEPDNQQALITLLLALTDQLEHGIPEYARKAREVLPRLTSAYEEAYYEGIIYERQGRAYLKHRTPGGTFMAYQWFSQAMRAFEKAEAIRPPGNDDALLRWNTCARMLRRDQQLVPAREGRFEDLE